MDARDGGLLVTPSTAPSRDAPCARCGRPLGDGPLWVVDFPRAAHEACVDWSSRPFPYARHVDVLRFLARRVSRERRAAVERAAAALRRLGQRWPGDAVRVLDEGRRVLREARPLLAELDHRDRQRI